MSVTPREPAGLQHPEPDEAARHVDDRGHRQGQDPDGDRRPAPDRAAAHGVERADHEHDEGRAEPRADDHAVRLVDAECSGVEEGEGGCRHRRPRQHEERTEPAEAHGVGNRRDRRPEGRRQAACSVAHQRQRDEEDPQRQQANDDAAHDGPARGTSRGRGRGHAPTARGNPGEGRRIEIAVDADQLKIIGIGRCARVVGFGESADHAPRGRWRGRASGRSSARRER